MPQYAVDEIEKMPDSPVAREDLGAGASRGAGARSPLFWKVLLLSVAVIWGYSFTTMKDVHSFPTRRSSDLNRKSVV